MVALIQWNRFVSASSAVIAWKYASDNDIGGGFDLSYEVSSDANKSALDIKRNIITFGESKAGVVGGR